MEITLYERDGHPVAYIADDSEHSIYTWDGHAVCYIMDEKIYGWKGHHIGWFHQGIIYDIHEIYDIILKLFFYNIYNYIIFKY